MVYAPLFHGFEALGRDIHRHFAVEFRDEKGLFLEIYLAAASTGRREFSRTGAVRIPASDAGTLTSYYTVSCHTLFYEPAPLEALLSNGVPYVRELYGKASKKAKKPGRDNMVH